MNRDAEIEPDIATEPVNCEPIEEDVAPVITSNILPLATDAVALPLAIKGDAAATTFVN